MSVSESRSNSPKTSGDNRMETSEEIRLVKKSKKMIIN